MWRQPAPLNAIPERGPGSESQRAPCHYLCRLPPPPLAPCHSPAFHKRRFRSPLGRLLFATSGLFQSVLPGPDPGSPPLVINKVAFKLFGIIPGAIGLRGKAFPMGADQDTVNVLFDPPVLSLGNVHLRLGPPSSVVLTTTYVDERVRLGKGSRGSLFVFTRSAEADAAEMEKVGTQRSGVSGLLAIAALFAALAGGGAACWAAGASALKGAAVALWLLALLTGAVLWRGGIVQDDQDEAALQQARRREAQQAGNNAAVSGTATVAAAAGGSG